MGNKKYIQSLERASVIVQYIAARGKAKLKDISTFTGLKTSTVFGLLQTLEHIGHVARVDNGMEYTLGLNSLKLGLSYINGSGINDRIHKLLELFVEAIDETAYFALQIGNRYYYLDYILSSQPLKVVPEEGNFIDLPDQTAVAIVFNNTDANFTFAMDLENVYKGMNCFAAPFYTGNIITGCVAASGPSNRFTKEKMEEAYKIYRQILSDMGWDA